MKRSKHSLSHYKLLTCDMGELIPAACFEVLPGDSIQQASSVLCRLSPLVAPMMHPVVMRMHHWFVPYRLLWSNWEDFITGGEDGLNASVFPVITFASGTAPGGLPDYLGIGSLAAGQQVSALPFRAYNLIWNEHYRDQDLVTAASVGLGDGVDGTTNVGVRRVSWEKDYYTSARPFAQKGPAISLPLGTSAPVVTPGNVGLRFLQANGSAPNSGATSLDTAGDLQMLGGTDIRPTNLQADLTLATAASVIDLRRNLALQRFAENRAKFGARYSEYLAYLGVRTNDGRLQRPEYLGGGRQLVQVSEVLQTAVTTSGTDLGVANLKGHGIGAMRSNRYRRYFTEHGLIMSLLSVLPRTMYYQGIPRQFNRRTRTDFYQKELEEIGQQEVLNKELYAVHSTPEGIFGYQDRYDEYRRMESTVSGDFKSSTLNFYHMGRDFSANPVLNQSFVEATPTKRVHAVQTNDVLWVMINHSIQARRLLKQSAALSRIL